MAKWITLFHLSLFVRSCYGYWTFHCAEKLVAMNRVLIIHVHGVSKSLWGYVTIAINPIKDEWITKTQRRNTNTAVEWTQNPDSLKERERKKNIKKRQEGAIAVTCDAVGKLPHTSTHSRSCHSASSRNRSSIIIVLLMWSLCITPRDYLHAFGGEEMDIQLQFLLLFWFFL